MKKTLLAASVLFASLMPATALADGGPVFGLDAQAALPVGNFSDGAGVGFGGLLRYEFSVMSSTNITLRAGFMYHLEKNSSTFYSIPLLGGVRVRLGQWAFIAAEAGAFVNHPGKFDTALGFTFAVGYRVSTGVDLRLGAEMVDAGHAGDSIALIGGVGFNF
jgi:hypothetical protein